MKSYKDWKIRSKILFAAIAPFILAVIVLAPFMTNKAMLNVEENAKRYVDELAYSASLEVLSDLEKTERELRVLAQVLEGIISSEKPDRATVNKILKSVAEKNQSLLGVWSVWEENAFDGRDKEYSNTLGHDATGRFIPYWTRENGVLELRALRHYNNEKIGNYHFISKQTKREVMLNPYTYKIANIPSTITTISFPIFSATQNFVGTVGIDIILTALQDSITKVRPLDIGASGIISSEGIYIANSDIEKNGTKVDLSATKLEYVKNIIASGESYSDEYFDNAQKENVYRVIYPINLGTVDNNWAFIMDIPLSPIKAHLYYSMFFVVVIIFVCLVLGVSVALITAKNIASPITEISEALEKISAGNTGVKIPDIQTNDEVGMMSASAYIFKQHAIDLVNAKQSAERANKAKTDFLSSMSHELRTPMHAILGYSKLGLDKVEEKESKIFRYFTNISNSGERLLSLINDLLDISKMESGTTQFYFETRDIVECVDNAAAELQSLFDKKKIKLVKNYSVQNSKADFDYNRITQVIINILSNAIKFSSEGDEVEISVFDTKIETNGQIEEAVGVSICDKGVGIPEGELEKVFEKFMQSTNVCKMPEGTGLGLSISRMIIKHHNGKIWAQNNKDKGVTINITIPHKLMVPNE